MDRGITLLELLLVLSLSMIFVSVSFPLWQTFFIEGQVAGLTNCLVEAIYLTRSEAIKWGELITFCGSSDGQHCDGRWSQGQLVHVTSTGELLRSYTPYPVGYRLFWRSNLNKNGYLNFNSSGFTDGQQGSFYICPPRKYEQSMVRLIITRSGRLRRDRDKVYDFCRNNNE